MTGDLYFHVAHDAMMMGLNVVDPGHYAEKIMRKGTAEKLTAMAGEKTMTSAFSLPKQIQTHLLSYKKTEAPGLSFLFLLSEGFFKRHTVFKLPCRFIVVVKLL